MNTTNASPHETNKETTKNPLDVRIILAVLRIARNVKQSKWGYLPVRVG